MKNNKGVTLLSLAIMIVVLIILASIGMNYSSNSIKLARLTKFTTEFEIINTQISILNQNKNHVTYENYGLDETEDAELISEIDSLLEDKLVNIYKVDEADIEAYKNGFQYCSKDEAKEKLDIDGIEGNYLINIQNKMVISFDGIKYNGNWYYTLEELERDELATNTYKVEYHKYENPYIPKGCYYVGGTWDTGYVISDSQDDKYVGNQYREINKSIAQTCTGNLYMWIPIIEKDENNTNGINWSAVISHTDYINIKTALDTYKAPEYSSDWYTTDGNARYAYSNAENRLIEYSNSDQSEEDTNNLLSSIYLNGGMYIKIHTVTDSVQDPEALPSQYQKLEYIESTGTQYIDTGIAQNEISEISGEFQFAKFGNSHQGMCGRYTSNYTSINIVYNYSNGNLSYRWGANNYSISADLNKHSFTIGPQSLIVDDTIVSTYSSDSLSDTDTLVIFARRTDNSGTTVINGANLKLYKFQIKSNGVIVRNFIPCYRKSDNAVGMYDIVNDIFYTNTGTGTFLYNIT